MIDIAVRRHCTEHDGYLISWQKRAFEGLHIWVNFDYQQGSAAT